MRASRSSLWVLLGFGLVGIFLTTQNLTKSASELSFILSAVLPEGPYNEIRLIPADEGENPLNSIKSVSETTQPEDEPSGGPGEKDEKKEEDKVGEKDDKEVPATPLNIVFLYGDDWRHDSIGVANASIVRTPFLDWLATQGIRFTHNCVTTSVCWISRANLYTGQYVSRHQSDYPHKPLWYEGWKEAWPQILRDNGYYLGHVGKWHFNWTKLVYNTFHFSRSYYGLHWYPELLGGRIHVTAKNEKDAMDFLRKKKPNKPFMLSVCFFAPHSQDGADEQYFPQEESMSLYANETVAVPISATPKAWRNLPRFFGEANEGRRRWRIRFDTAEKHQRMMKNYFRLISEIDQSSERIYREVERQGLLNNTMFIFTTDNGLFHSEHQLAGKWYPHQESIRVPLIIKDPRMPKEMIGTVNDDFTLNIDLASTILGAAGIEQPSVMQGRDIADLYLENSAPKWREEFFYEHPTHLNKRIIPASTALVRKKFKYMTWPDFDNFEQFFDLEKDPFELRDLIRVPEYQDLIAQMRTRHDHFKKAVLDPGPIDEVIADVLQKSANGLKEVAPKL